jgi:hypothetical protein
MRAQRVPPAQSSLAEWRKSRHGFQIAQVLIVAHVQAAGVADGLKVSGAYIVRGARRR